MLGSTHRTSAAVVASGALHVLLVLNAQAPSLLTYPSRTLGMRVEFAILPPREPSAPTRPAPLQEEVVEPAAQPLATEPGPQALALRSAQRSAAGPTDARRSPEPALPTTTSALAPADPASPQRAPSPVDSTASTSSEATPTLPSSESDNTVAAARAKPQRALDLSAASAAHSLLASEAGSWRLPTSDRAEREAMEREARAEELRLAEGIKGLTRHGDERGVAPIAQDAVSFVLRPWKVITEPLRSARYHYRGSGFDAIIQADGAVRFRGKDGVHLALIPAMLVTGQSAATVGIGLGRELFTHRHARDAHASERRTFLDRTRALRMHLYQQALRAALARAERELTLTLANIEVQLERGNDRRARTTLFELWDECSEDELGAAARALVERFVREHCAPGTPVGYEAEELAALNARRVSKTRFDPFASAVEPAPSVGTATQAADADARSDASSR